MPNKDNKTEEEKCCEKCIMPDGKDTFCWKPYCICHKGDGADEVKDTSLEDWQEPVKKLLGYYNAEILNKYQDKYLMEKGPGCEEVLYPVLEKALANFLNPPDDGMVRKFSPESFISEVRKATEAHDTKEDWCCACGYDIAVMEDRIKATEEKVRGEIVGILEKEMGQGHSVETGATISDIIKTITDK